jgi:hypothetical protein
MSGSTSSPDSDDDIQKNVQAMGFHLDEKEGEPEELNTAAEIDKAEEFFKTH